MRLSIVCSQGAIALAITVIILKLKMGRKWLHKLKVRVNYFTWVAPGHFGHSSLCWTLLRWMGTLKIPTTAVGIFSNAKCPVLAQIVWAMLKRWRAEMNQKCIFNAELWGVRRTIIFLNAMDTKRTSNRFWWVEYKTFARWKVFCSMKT